MALKHTFNESWWEIVLISCHIYREKCISIVPAPSFLTLGAAGWWSAAHSWGNRLEDKSQCVEKGRADRGCILDNIIELLNKYKACPASGFPVHESKWNDKALYLVYFLLVILPLSSQDILTGTLGKNRSSGMVGIGSNPTVEVQLNCMWRRETLPWLGRESEKEEIKPTTLLYKAVYVGITGVKSGVRKVLAQIPSLPFVSYEQVI